MKLEYKTFKVEITRVETVKDTFSENVVAKTKEDAINYVASRYDDKFKYKAGQMISSNDVNNKITINIKE